MLTQKLNKYNVILASGSPRRQNFLKQLNIPFTIDVRQVDEVYPKHLKAAEISDYLADLKSKAFADLKDNDLVITSDTIVWFEGKAMGKPKDAEEAFSMLKAMSGKKHQVFTSVSIKNKHFQRIFHEETTVEFDDLSDEEIWYYLETYQPYDKAGSYGIQDWIGLIGVTKLEGSYFNVVGLPVHKLYKELLAIAV
jgi:septum formation protein